MPKVKSLNLVVNYGDTGYYVNDLGETKSPRFELYYEPEAKVVLKTDNPIDCNKWMQANIWKEFFKEINNKEDELPKKKSRKKGE